MLEAYDAPSLRTGRGRGPAGGIRRGERAAGVPRGLDGDAPQHPADAEGCGEPGPEGGGARPRAATRQEELPRRQGVGPPLRLVGAGEVPLGRQPVAGRRRCHGPRRNGDGPLEEPPVRFPSAAGDRGGGSGAVAGERGIRPGVGALAGPRDRVRGDPLEEARHRDSHRRCLGRRPRPEPRPLGGLHGPDARRPQRGLLEAGLDRGVRPSPSGRCRIARVPGEARPLQSGASGANARAPLR